MHNKSFKRVLAALLAAVLTLSNFGNMSVVSAQETKVRTASNAQMNSDPEVVYVNTYSDATVREQNFDDNWKFYLGDASGAESKTYDDSRWENVNLPHDYSIEQEFTSAGEAESGYLLGGTGWYRKYFTLAESLKGKEIRIDFGGVYMDSTVWVNGTKLGTHPYGYTPFSFDITDYVQFGKENVITVKVNHQTPSSRWYSGSGIYRSVNLTITDKVHVDLYGTKISTPNLETEKGGTVNVSVKTTVANAGAEAANVALTHTIYEKGTSTSIGTVTTGGQSVAAGGNTTINATIQANNPKLWSTKKPNLYTVVTEVKVGENVVDTYETEYGFRYIKFDTNTGFSLNGEKMKLKGVCMHHDQGALGAEAYYRAIERQVELLQDMGCNSIRVTHNPAADELIEICNEKGILVIDEFFDGWMYSKNGNSKDYARFFNKQIEADNQILSAEEGMTWAEFDLKATINRGENAPSVIMWSLGNEIQEGAGGSGYAAKADDLISWSKETGTTKLLTIGSNAVKNAIGNDNDEHVQIANKLTAVGGVSGTNYSGGGSYDNMHNTYPGWFIYGSETASHVNSRGVYNVTGSQQLNADKALTSYDYSAVGWGATASSAWYDVITRDFVAGEYVWTGFDYLGEPTPNNGTDAGWKNGVDSPKNSFFGIIDTAGLPKDNYYFYQSQWNDEVNTLHVLPAWNSDVVKKDSSNNVPVVVYSDAAKVKLTFTDKNGNNRDLGTKEFTTKTTSAGYKYQIFGEDSTRHQDLYLTWNVPYADGTITATAYDAAGNEITNTVGRASVTTTGAAAKLEASVDRSTIKADGKDLAYITVDVTDANGNIVPNAANNVKFTVEGNGVLVGVDNGKQSDHQSFQDNNRKAFNGSLVAIVQSTKEDGTFTVTATSDGLEATTVNVTTTAVAGGTTTEKQVNSFYMSKNYYIMKGSELLLPTEIETRYTNGNPEMLPVTWGEIGDTNETGTFLVQGTVDDYNVTVSVNVIDEVGGLLNYSTSTRLGSAPILPDTRPAVLMNGEVLNVSFPVAWEDIPEDNYNEAGTFVVEGSANVLGKPIEVTASVRVEEAQITIGDSVSGAAYVTQTQGNPSDTLNSIKDGSTTKSANTQGGVNPTCWSNWADAQNGVTTSELQFRYDTNQTVGEIVIHFGQDGNAGTYPEANSTEIYSSTDGGTTWINLAFEETLGESVDDVKPYTYSFAKPFDAELLKFCITNSPNQKGNAKPCTMITEIEVLKATGTYTTNTTAELASLTVNGVAATEAELAEGKCYTTAQSAEVVAVGKDNAAVTVLPVYEDNIILIIESEDHYTRESFVIHLNEEKPITPDDASRDIPVSVLTVTAGDQHNDAHRAENVLDNDPGTIWHSNWSTVTPEKHYLDFELSEEYVVNGLRYLPRSSGGANGTITKYRILVSGDKNNWEPVAEGNWASNTSWKMAAFEGQTKKYVRLVSVEAVTDQNDVFASAAEVRLIGKKVSEPAPEANLTAITVNTAPKTVYTEGDAFDPDGLVLNLVYDNGEVRELTYAADTGITFNATEALALETTSVKITYGEFTTTLPIIVVAVEVPEKPEIPELEADDDSRDYPAAKLEASTGSQQYDSGNEGPAANALDGDVSTIYHSAWNPKADDEQLWVQFELEEVARLSALRYLPRQDLNNGAVKEYEVSYSMDGSEWNVISKGNWEVNNSWKLAMFDSVVEAKYVKIFAVDSVADNSGRHFSAAEIRLVVAPETEEPDQQEKTLAGILVNEAPKTAYFVGDEFDPTGLKLTLAYSDGSSETLDYTAEAGITFDVTGALATAGTQPVTITYNGKTTTLNVHVQAVTLASISVATAPDKVAYSEGEKFDPTGLELNLNYSNGTEGTVAYDENTDKFSFEPALDAVLTADNTSVAITYDGKTTAQPITVKANAVLERIEVKTAPNKIVYEKGESLDPTGLVLTLIYSDTSTEEVKYSADNADYFSFAPASDLQKDSTITVTYKDKTAEIAVIVEDISEQDPDAPEVPDVPVMPEAPEVNVPTSPVTPDKEYKIYPNPQDMTYYEGSWVVRGNANVIYEDSIDDVTKARLEKVLAQKNVTSAEGTELVSGKTNILVGTYGSNGYVDQFVKENFTVSEGLFDKIDAYFLASTKDIIVVLGKDTDAAFYGLTSLYHIFTQMGGKEIKNFIMEDWADTAIRGFIEGYYGIPWSNEDRMSLMTFGGNFKMTSYVFAPKDDPYHKEKWRELYPQAEIEAIAEMVEVGNNEKCRFVWTAHPFMGGFNANRVDDEINSLLAKFDQLYDVGVRQFGVLGDDVGSLDRAIVIRIMNAVSEWANEKGDVYDSVFCPGGYNHSWQGDYSELNAYDAGFPDNVQIFWTGEAVCQPVEQKTLEHFRNHNLPSGQEERRAPLFWLNWPVNDINHSRMLMGKGSLLHTDIDTTDLAGIVTNPMQEAEASKVAIFAIADYAWNVKDFDDDQSWADSFAYVDADASEALHTLAKHMSNPQPNGHGLVLAESEELQPLINRFKSTLTSGASLENVGVDLVEEMDVIIDACDEFHEKSKNENLKDELLPFTNSLKDLATAIKNYTLAAMALEKGNDAEAFDYYSVGVEANERSKTYTKPTLSVPEIVDPGSTHLMPLVEALEDAISDQVLAYVYGEDGAGVKFTASSNITSWYAGNPDSIIDGNSNTHAWHDGAEAVGQYYQVSLSKPSTVYGIEVLNGTTDKPQDTFGSAKLQYKVDGEDSWKDVPNGATTTTYQQTVKVDRLELENVTAVRYVCTATGGQNKWPSMREFTVKLTRETVEAPEFTCEVIRTSNEEGWVASSDANVIDGNESTSVHYTVRNTAEAQSAGYKDSMLAGDYIGLKLSQPITLGRIRIVQGLNDSHGDYMQNAKLQYSLDGTNWNDIETTTERIVDIDVSVQNITAQYVRLVQTAQQNNWFAIREFSVEAKQEYNAEAFTNVETYAKAPANLGTDRHELVAISDVTLTKDQYIGLKLNRISELIKIELNDGTLPEGVILQVSKNAVEWDNVNAGTIEKDARYIRLVNTGNTEVKFNISKFVVTTAEVEEKSVEDTNYTSFDGKLSNLFDGDWTTAYQFANSQTQGKYIVIDLGQEIAMNSFKAVCRDSEHDFPRHAKFSVSANGTDFEEIMTIGNQDSANTGEANNSDNINDVLPNHEISYNTISVTGLNKTVRYLKFEITRTKEGLDKWVRFQEFEINGGAYIPTENNPTVEGVGETLTNQYSALTDKNLSTVYTWEDGALIYNVSEPGMNAVKIIQSGISNAVVEVRFTGTNSFVEVGTLLQTISEFIVGDQQIAQVKIKTPATNLFSLLFRTSNTATTVTSIAEISVSKKEQETVDKSELSALVSNLKNTTNWTTDSKKAYEEVIDNAKAVLANNYVSQAIVDSMIQAVNKVIASKELKGDANLVTSVLAKLNSGIQEEDYTADSWSNYETVVNAAEDALRERDNLSTADVSELIAKLRAANTALKYNTTNYEDAALYLDDLSTMDSISKFYTEVTYAEFDRLYEALEDMVAAGAQAQYTPNNFAESKEALNKAVKALIPVGELPALIEEFEETDENIYTEKSWDRYKDAVEGARELLINGKTRAINAAISNITAKKERLAVKADEEAVKALIKDAEAKKAEDYTTESFEAFTEKLTEVKAKDLSELNTLQLRNVGNSLQDAINDLVSVKALKELVATGEAKNKDSYTESSYKTLQDAIEKAKACYEDGSANDVSKATEKLLEAIENLKIPSSDTPSSGGSSSNDKDKEEDKPVEVTPAPQQPATPSQSTTQTQKPAATKPQSTTTTETTTPSDEVAVPGEKVDTKIVEETASEEVKEAVKETVVVTEEKATVTTETVEKVIENTEKGETVILPLTEAAEEGQVVKEAEVPVEALEKIVEAESALTVEFEGVKVTLEPEAIKAIAEQAKGSTIEIRVVPVEHHELHEKQQKALEKHDVAVRVSAQIFSDGEYIGDFKGGKARIAIPFTPEAGRAIEDYNVYYVADDGDMTRVRSAYEKEHMIIETDHFSDYVIIYEGADAEVENTEAAVEEEVTEEAPVEEVQEEKSGAPVLPIIIGVVVVIAIAAVMVMKKKKDN